MKKSSMKSLVSYFESIDMTEDIRAIYDEMVAELAKDEAKAQANRDMYAEAKDIILGALSDTPATISEIYAEVADALPEGFTKSKVQYAITRLWSDEVVKTEGKVNTYSRKA